ncbi:rod shape-determining protein MreC [Actinoplanes sp. NPDC051346]|uniref:rod shape-determining protein MreC n=1 Tax=Actinoplanes sp. NPDC051346 TaxID=3155048 RepID=UPI0034319514
MREATDVWDRAKSAGPHTAVRPLVATRDRRLHSVVVLQGYDKKGAARLAFFTSDTSAGDALRLRTDRPAPDPVSTQVISLVSPRLTGPAGAASNDGWGTSAIAIAAPGVTTLRMSSTTIDQELIQDPGSETGRFVVQMFNLATTASTVTVTGFSKSTKILSKPRKVFTLPADGGADGDARAVRGAVIGRTDQQIVVALPADRSVQPGQLAVVAAGVVGRVTAVDQTGGEATIDLVTSPRFTSQAYTNISDVPGSVRGAGTKLVMEHIPPGEKMYVYQTNRVVVPDPSQQDRSIGAVTIGRASEDKADGADTVDLTPTADLAHLRDVSIMTPFDQG